jgi:hypothetical protein
MGLIVSLAYRADERAVDLELTFTIVWDPVWTRKRIREDARETMRGLGIVA